MVLESATPRNQKKTTGLGSQQSTLFHRKNKNDPDMRSEWKSRMDRQLRWCLHREPRICSQGSLEQPQRHFEAQMPLKNQVALEPSELEVSTTQQQDTGAGRLLSPLHEGDQARGALWLASPGQRKQLWLGSGLGWPAGLGQGIRMALDFSLSDFSFHLLHFPQEEPCLEAA